jgi:hypothetical protein
MFKNILLIISGGVIIYLLKNKQTKTKKVELKNDANLFIGDGDQYKASIYSNMPIKAEIINKVNDHTFNVKLQSNVYDDNVKINGVPVVY